MDRPIILLKISRYRLFGFSLAKTIEFLTLTILGTLAGIMLLANGSINFGPFNTDFSIRPALSGYTKVELGPLGSLSFKSHSGPISVLIKVNSLEPKFAEKWVNSKDKFTSIPSDAGENIRNNFSKIAVRAIIGGIIFSFFLVIISFRRLKIAILAAVLSLILNLIVSSYAYLTFRPTAITQPTYKGLISVAPTLVGSAREIATNFQQYRSQVAALLENASKISNLSSDSSQYQIPSDVITVLHVSDLHLNPAGWDLIRQLVKAYGVKVIADTGDISDHGTAFEDSYLDEIPKLKIPYLYVRGNHDSVHTQNYISTFPNAKVLDGGTPLVVEGLTFVGLGDPTFTPDKSKDSDIKTVIDSQNKYAQLMPNTPINIFLVHNPVNVKVFDGKTDLILAGHLHKRSFTVLPKKTLLMIQGSTGGGGLRMITNREVPAKLEANILYFDKNTKKLVAYDEISIGGMGDAYAEIVRKTPNQ
jgi:predicted MPP superfamily phosphohydrolase